MIPLATLAAPVLNFLTEAIKHWRVILASVAGIWIIICCLSHCGHRCPDASLATNSTDTVYIQPDTTKWTRIKGSITPVEVKPATPIKINQPAPDLTCSELVSFYQGQVESLRDRLQDARESRFYANTLETDSFRLHYEILTEGRLLQSPEFSIQHTFPSLSIKETVTQFVPTPYRSINLGVGIGPNFTYPSSIRSFQFSAELSYSDLKDWTYGVRGTVTHLDWSTQIFFTKSFGIKK